MQDKLKQAYQEQVKAQIDELEARIELLKTQANKVKADAKVEFNKQLSDIREQQQELQTKVQTLRQAGESAWQDLTEGIDQALTKLGGAVENAFSRFQGQ